MSEAGTQSTDRGRAEDSVARSRPLDPRSVEVRVLSAGDAETWSAFRYRVAVEQLGRDSIPGVDHDRRRLEDPLDGTAHALGAFHEGTMIGGVRAHYCREVPDHPLAALYRMDQVDPLERSLTSLTTHLMIDEAWQSRGVGLVLISSMFEYSVNNGVYYDRIDVFEHNEKLFTRMGYERSGAPIERPGFGLVIPMRLDTRDDKHLERCRSPLRKFRRKLQARLEILGVEGIAGRPEEAPGTP